MADKPLLLNSLRGVMGFRVYRGLGFRVYRCLGFRV